MQAYALAAFHEGNHQIIMDWAEISKYAASPLRAFSFWHSVGLMLTENM